MNRTARSFTLGVVHTRRNLGGEFFCNVDAALKRKRQVEAKLAAAGVRCENIDFLNGEGVIFNGLDAERAAARLNELGVDAVFAPHLNFGCEDAVAKVAKRLNKPVLLWGPRDDAPDASGNRCTDSQCGLFATGKVLRQFGVPFTYMTNCSLDDPVFDRVFHAFVSAAHAVKAFRGMRVGQIGVRPETFWSVKCNELQLLEHFGIEVVPATLVELENIIKDVSQNRRGALDGMVAQFKDAFDIKVGDEYLYRTAALQSAIGLWAEEYGLDGVASSCWDAMRQMSGVASCFAFSELTDQGLPVVCEMDIHGAIASVMAQAATRWQKASFLADVTTRHPTNDNAELFWHCGVFPKSVASARRKPAIAGNFDQNAPAVGNFMLREEGQVTISRFDCSGDRYQLLTARGSATEGPKTTGTYGWLEFKDWPAIEHKLAAGPYIHHCVGVYDDISAILHEACKYLGIDADPAEPGEAEIQAFWR